MKNEKKCNWTLEAPSSCEKCRYNRVRKFKQTCLAGPCGLSDCMFSCSACSRAGGETGDVNCKFNMRKVSY